MSAGKRVQRVLITGASGYLGGFVVQRLRSAFDLTLFDRVAPRSEDADLPFILGDVADAEAVHHACRGQNAVVHMASIVRERLGKPPALFADVIVKGTWHVAEACVEQGVGRLVNISTASITWPRIQLPAGVPVPLPKDGPIDIEALKRYVSLVSLDKEQSPRGPIPVEGPVDFNVLDLYYKLGKALAEKIGDAYHAAHGLAVIHLRPGPIFGDGATGEPTAGDATLSAGRFFHVHPRDVAQAVHGALTSEVTYGRYAIVAGRADSLFEWESAAREIGYAPTHNWSEIPELGLLRLPSST